jgi:very-short-patch-repair endonuclease
MKSRLERTALHRIMCANVGDPQEEYRFHPKRMWRFDFAFPDKKIAIECEGGIWTEGAHTRGKHFISDAEKYNEAAMLGWCVLRYTTNTVINIESDLRRIMKVKQRGGCNDTRKLTSNIQRVA